MRKISAVIGFWIYCVAVSTVGAVGDSTSNRATLKGLPGVIVGVSTVSCESAGLYESVLNTEVELLLRQNKIKVLEQGPLLAVKVGCYTVSGDNIKGYAFHVGLAVQQVILWPYPPPKMATVITWRSFQYVGTGNRESLSQQIRRLVRDLVNQFINAWLSVNPIQ